MTFHFAPTFVEQWLAQLHTTLRSKFLFANALLVPLLVSIALLVPGIMPAPRYHDHIPLPVALPFIALSFGFWPFLMAGIIFQGRWLNPASRGQHTFVLEESAFTVSTPTTSGTFKWAGTLRVAETASLFLVFVGPHATVFLPKRAVPPAQLPGVRDFFFAHVAAA